MSSTLRICLGPAEGHYLALLNLLRPEPRKVSWCTPSDEEPRPDADGLDAAESLIELTDAERAQIAAFDAAFVEALEAAAHPESQASYESAVRKLFATLDALETRLETQRFPSGEAAPNAADWWIFCHLLRFDPVYFLLFKCSMQRLVDYPQLYGFVRDLFQRPGVDGTFDVDAMQRWYYLAEPVLNPKRTLPRGGVPDLMLWHDRGIRFGENQAGSAGTEEAQGVRRLAGEWVRPRSAHRHQITADGSSDFPAEAGRYHLYVANNCPWSHRAALGRSVLGLTEVVSMDALYYRRDAEHGWQFNPEEPGCTPDTLFGSRYLKEIYARAGSTEKSVPLLFDKESGRIVSNESAEILRMFDRAFGALKTRDIELCPDALRPQIDALNAWIYQTVNNGSYKAGFTGAQAAHDKAQARFFVALDALEDRLADRRFLLGDDPTEADLRLYPTLFRFDPVYHTRFRLNQRMLRDYTHLPRWLADFGALPGVAEASNIEHCKRGYFGRTGNNIIPLTER